MFCYDYLQATVSAAELLRLDESMTRWFDGPMSLVAQESFARSQGLHGFPWIPGSGVLNELKRSLVFKETFARSSLAAILSIFIDLMCFLRTS